MSNLQQYLKHVEGVTNYRRNLARVSKLTGSAPTLLGSHALATHVQGAAPKIEWGVGTAAGLVAGGIIGAKHGHWLLGSVSGASVFTNVPALLKPEQRKEAFWNLAQTHAGIFASMAVKDDSAGKKTARFLLGYLAVGVVRYLYREKP